MVPKLYTKSRLKLSCFEGCSTAVCLVNVEDITSYTNWQNIRTFIASVYNDNSSPISGHLPFVLLAGDAYDDDNVGGGFIPSTTNILGSDHGYAACNGSADELEDVALGRISVGNYDELRFVVDKIIRYETNSACAGDWKTNIMMQSAAGG